MQGADEMGLGGGGVTLTCILRAGGEQQQHLLFPNLYPTLPCAVLYVVVVVLPFGSFHLLLFHLLLLPIKGSKVVEEEVRGRLLGTTTSNHHHHPSTSYPERRLV